MQKISQAAVELIVILAAALVILLSIVIINSTTMTASSSQLEETKARSALDDIVNAAELVYQGGVGGKTRVFVTLPGNIASVNINNKLVEINLLTAGGLNNIHRTTDFAVSGSIPITEGNYWIDIESRAAYVLIGTEAAAFCGNNIAEGTEACDGTDLRGQTCVSQGYSGGTLACQPGCNVFDTSGCTTLTTCQQACSSLGFGSWMCRSSCGGSWRNPAPNGNAWCTAQQGLPVCCCR